MKIKIYKIILLVGLFLTSIQWVVMTAGMIRVMKLGGQALVLEAVPTYYLLMICVILCAGFLHLENK